ncbi:hypothetical protein B566_EDAN008299, partial [Ephemera danica]
MKLSSTQETSVFVIKILLSSNIYTIKMVYQKNSTSYTLIQHSGIYLKNIFHLEMKPLRFDKKNCFLQISLSMHASRLELISILRYLKPKSVFACVVPQHMTLDEINEELHAVAHGLACTPSILHNHRVLSYVPPAPASLDDEILTLHDPCADLCSNATLRPSLLNSDEMVCLYHRLKDSVDIQRSQGTK